MRIAGSWNSCSQIYSEYALLRLCRDYVKKGGGGLMRSFLELAYMLEQFLHNKYDPIGTEDFFVLT